MDNVDDNFDDIDFDNLVGNPQSELYDFGIGQSSRPDLASFQLVPILENAGGMVDSILRNPKFEEELERIGELKIYSKAIDSNFLKDTSKNIGTQVARNQILEGSASEFDEGIKFLRGYNSRSLGQLITSLKRRKEGREENTRKLFRIFGIEIEE